MLPQGLTAQHGGTTHAYTCPQPGRTQGVDRSAVKPAMGWKVISPLLSNQINRTNTQLFILTFHFKLSTFSVSHLNIGGTHNREPRLVIVHLCRDRMSPSAKELSILKQSYQACHQYFGPSHRTEHWPKKPRNSDPLTGRAIQHQFDAVYGKLHSNFCTQLS